MFCYVALFLLFYLNFTLILIFRCIGAFIVLNAANLEIIREDRKAKQYITDIKFSADRVAFASGDGRVYIHENVNFGHLITVETTAMYSAVTKIDFSVDGRYLALSTNSHELFYYSLVESHLISAPLAVRDVVWQNPTVSYAWNTQGELFMFCGVCDVYDLNCVWCCAWCLLLHMIA